MKKWDKWSKNTKRVDLNSTLLITNLNVYGLQVPVKVTEMIRLEKN
jgi:hypothetical protein